MVPGLTVIDFEEKKKKTALSSSYRKNGKKMGTIKWVPRRLSRNDAHHKDLNVNDKNISPKGNYV